MIEELKKKAVLSMMAKLSEQIMSGGVELPALVKFERLGDSWGKSSSINFSQLNVYIAIDALDLIADLVTVRGVVYEVVNKQRASEYNGFAKVELTEITTKATTGAWR